MADKYHCFHLPVSAELSYHSILQSAPVLSYSLVLQFIECENTVMKCVLWKLLLQVVGHYSASFSHLFLVIPLGVQSETLQGSEIFEKNTEVAQIKHPKFRF